MRLRVDRRAMSASLWDFAHRFERIEIENSQTSRGSGARDVKPPASRVGIDVIEPAVAADFGCLENMIGAVCGWPTCQSRHYQQGDRRQDQGGDSTHKALSSSGEPESFVRRSL